MVSNQVDKEDVGPSEESEERGGSSKSSIVDSVVSVSCVVSSMLILVVWEVLLWGVVALW